MVLFFGGSAMAYLINYLWNLKEKSCNLLKAGLWVFLVIGATDEDKFG